MHVTAKKISSNLALKSRTGLNSSIVSVIKNHLVYYPTPSNLFYVWGLGSLLGIMLIIQVITGVLLAMHYVPNIDLAFESVERIIREVPSG